MTKESPLGFFLRFFAAALRAAFALPAGSGVTAKSRLRRYSSSGMGFPSAGPDQGLFLAERLEVRRGAALGAGIRRLAAARPRGAAARLPLPLSSTLCLSSAMRSTTLAP